MEEREFFNTPTASVTSSKIVINGSTYATRNVGSVRVLTVPRPKWPWLLLLIGLVVCMTSLPTGMFMVVMSILVIWQVGPKARLHLMAGGGETMAIESKNVAHVNQLHQAIVEAISAR